MSRTSPQPPNSYGQQAFAAAAPSFGQAPSRQYSQNQFAAQTPPPAHDLGPGMNATPTYTRGSFSMPVQNQAQWNRMRGMDDKSLKRMQATQALLRHMQSNRQPRGVQPTGQPTAQPQMQNQMMKVQALRQPRTMA